MISSPNHGGRGSHETGLLTTLDGWICSPDAEKRKLIGMYPPFGENKNSTVRCVLELFGNFETNRASHPIRFVDTPSGRIRIALASFPFATSCLFTRFLTGYARVVLANWQTKAIQTTDVKDGAAVLQSNLQAEIGT